MGLGEIDPCLFYDKMRGSVGASLPGGWASTRKVTHVKNRFYIFLLVAACFAVSGAQRAGATPEPSAVPVAWELSLKPFAPMTIQVDTGKGASVYWYMVYTVTNNSGQDVEFHPEITRVSEIETEGTPQAGTSQSSAAPQITTEPAIVGIHPAVYKAIAERHAKTHPFLVSPVKAITRLLQGKDNAVTSVAIFPQLDSRVSRFTIYVGGLSGETLARPNPTYKAPSGESDEKSDEANPKFFVLKKTLAMPYILPGDLSTRRYATPKLGRLNWVMR